MPAYASGAELPPPNPLPIDWPEPWPYPVIEGPWPPGWPRPGVPVLSVTTDKDGLLFVAEDGENFPTEEQEVTISCTVNLDGPDWIVNHFIYLGIFDGNDLLIPMVAERITTHEGFSFTKDLTATFPRSPKTYKIRATIFSVFPGATDAVNYTVEEQPLSASVVTFGCGPTGFTASATVDDADDIQDDGVANAFVNEFVPE